MKQINDIDQLKHTILVINGEYIKWNNYFIRPIMMVKTYQSKYRNLSIVGFMNEKTRKQ